MRDRKAEKEIKRNRGQRESGGKKERGRKYDRKIDNL